MDSRKKYKIQGASPYPHIGNLIKKRVKEKGIPYSEAARRIGVTTTVFHAYLTKASVQLGIIWKIGIAIEHNFFADLMEHLPVETLNSGNSVFQNEIKDLKKEISIYKGILNRNG